MTREHILDFLKQHKVEMSERTDLQFLQDILESASAAVGVLQ